MKISLIAAMEYYFFILILCVCVVNILGNGCVKIDFSSDEQIDNCLGLDWPMRSMLDASNSRWKIESYTSDDLVMPFHQNSTTFITPLEPNKESCSLFTLKMHRGQIQINVFMSKMPDAFLYIKVFPIADKERSIVDWSSIESVDWKEMKWSTIVIPLPSELARSAYYSIAIVGAVRETGVLIIDSILYISSEFDGTCDEYNDKSKINKELTSGNSSAILRALERSNGLPFSELLAYTPYSQYSRIDSSYVENNRQKKAISDDYDAIIKLSWILPAVKYEFNNLDYEYDTGNIHEMTLPQLYSWGFKHCSFSKNYLQQLNRCLGDYKEFATILNDTRNQFITLRDFHKTLEHHERFIDVLRQQNVRAFKKLDALRDEIYNHEVSLESRKKEINAIYVNLTFHTEIVLDLEMNNTKLETRGAIRLKRVENLNNEIEVLKKNISLAENKTIEYEKQCESIRNNKSHLEVDEAIRTELLKQLKFEEGKITRLRIEYSHLKLLEAKSTSDVLDQEIKQLIKNAKIIQGNRDKLMLDKENLEDEIQTKSHELRVLDQKNDRVIKNCSTVNRKFLQLEGNIKREKSRNKNRSIEIDNIQLDLIDCNNKIEDTLEALDDEPLIRIDNKEQYVEKMEELKKRQQKEENQLQIIKNTTIHKHLKELEKFQEKKNEARAMYETIKAEIEENNRIYTELINIDQNPNRELNQSSIKELNNLTELCHQSIKNVHMELNRQRKIHHDLKKNNLEAIAERNKKRKLNKRAHIAKRKQRRQSYEKRRQQCTRTIVPIKENIDPNLKKAIEMYLWVGWNLLIIALLIFIAICAIYISHKLNAYQK